MTLLLQDTLVISPKTKEQVEKNTAAIAELQEKSAIAYHFKGSKPTFNDLPTTGNEVGDVWDVQDTGANYGWTGTEWDELGPIADLEPYLTKEEAAAIYSTKTETGAQLDEKADKATTYTKEETDTLLDAKADKTEVYRSLTSDQEASLLLTGKYNNEEIESEEIFLKENGTFGQYNAAPDPNIAWKKDGVVSGSLPVSESFNHASFVNNTFVISGYHTGSLALLSTDGINWTSSRFNDYSSHYYFSEGNGIIISTKGDRISTHNPSNILEISDTSQQIDGYGILGSCFGDGKFVISTSSKGFWYSTDGINWTQSEPLSLSSQNLGGSIVYGNGKFVSVSAVRGYAFVSEDGITWTSSSLSGWHPSLCFGKNKFVTVDQLSKRILYSEDGITWARVTLPITTDNVSYVAFDGDNFLATNDAGRIFYSTDGINWEANDVDSGSGTNLTVGNKMFVLVQGKVAPWYFKFGDMIRSLNPLSYTKTETNTLLDAKAEKATTLSGYGITDAYTKEEIDAKIGDIDTILDEINRTVV